MEREPRAVLWDARRSADAIARFLRGKGLDDNLADGLP